MSKTVQEFITLAEQALEGGDVDGVNKNMALADAAHKLDEAKKTLIVPAADAPGARVVRLPFEQDPQPDKPADQLQGEIKAWAAKEFYVKRWGQPDAAFMQVSRELYGTADYMRLSAEKYMDFNRYLMFGDAGCNSYMKRVMLLSPGEISEAIMHGHALSEVKTTMIEAQDTLGGYLVPEDYQQGQIISRLPGLTVVRPLARVVTTTRDVYTIAVRTGGDARYVGNVRVYPVDESPTGSTATTNATFGKINIPVNTLMATVSISRSVLEDAAIDLGAELGEEFGIARAIQEDEYYLRGNGVGVPQGILTNSTSGGPSDTNMTTVNSGAAALITADGLEAMPYGLAGQYRQAGAVWVMCKATLGNTRKLKDGLGRYLWSDNNNLLAAGQPEKLLGYEVKESEAMPVEGANYYPVIFGDMKGYRICDRVGMSIERYLDSTTAATDTVRYFMRWRGGGKPTEGWRFVVGKCAV